MQTAMKRVYYSDTIGAFLQKPLNQVLGELVQSSTLSGSSLDATQSDAWTEEIRILQRALPGYENRGAVFFEYSIPRLGKRIDVVLVIDSVIFVLEFKVGVDRFTVSAMDQVWDYALDLKNFHEPTHCQVVVPILIATHAPLDQPSISSLSSDLLFAPMRSNTETLNEIIAEVLRGQNGPPINHAEWIGGRYRPTPTIIEAAIALYKGHSVEDIARNDAEDLGKTSEAISRIIEKSRSESRKSICFVTGVPGAGKTLVGLNIATKYVDKKDELHSVFLSGNGPLVAILREALTRDKISTERARRVRIKKGTALSEVKAFNQNVHHFRDECIRDASRPPIEHVALFDEAQRAWNLRKTARFMLAKKKIPNFDMSEPEFLISCLNRHSDWAVIVCLVGGGQEINDGEAGITEWLESLNRSFPQWHIYISSRMTESEYAAGNALEMISGRPNVAVQDELHLAVSMRSFRAEQVSQLVKAILDMQDTEAQRLLNSTVPKYPIVLTRDLRQAKDWLRQHARGSERYGLVASSQAQRLKPHAIDVRSPVDPIHWFLDSKEDVRSSYYLEDAATEFDVQGLELDWACVTWDADFRYANSGWEHWSFCGDRWNKLRKTERKTYLKNAYRVLLTRARQGMVIFVPNGDSEDATRKRDFYDPTFEYLNQIGIEVI